MAIKTIKGEDFNWYNLTDFSAEELSFLKKDFKFHPLDLKDCAGEIQRSKIDIYTNYLFLVLQFPQLGLGEKGVIINQIYFFVGKKYIITVSRGKLKSLSTLFYKVANNSKFKEESFSKGSGYLFYKILDSLLRNSWMIHSGLENKIRKVENEIDEGRGKSAVLEIAGLRRLILQLQTVIDPQKMVSNTLSRLDTNFLTSEMKIYFDDIDDFVEKNWFILKSDKDRVLGLQEINESLISHQTNQVMKILTVFSVALLPLTLLSGIYGMNIDLPFTSHPLMILGFFGSMLLAIIITFIVLKKKDWM